jgi:hypothetical protein
MKSLMGGILLGAGILIAGASGLCSLVFLAMGVTEPGGLMSLLPMILLIGGIPFAIGLGLFFLGRSLIRSARRDALELSSGEQGGGGV